MFFDIFKKKKKEKPPKNITGEEMCDIFYNMFYYYDSNSSNIAIMKNRKIFNWQLSIWLEKLNDKRGDSVSKLDEDRYLFIIDEQEINIVMIRSIADLNIRQMKFRRFMG